MSLHRLYPVFIGSQEIDGIQSLDFSDGIEARCPPKDGIVDGSTGFIAGDNPRLNFATLNISQVLTSVGFGGLDGDVTWFDAKMDVGGAFTAGSTHILHKLDNATTYSRRLSAQEGGDAIIACESIGWNVSAHPMSRTPSSPLTAHTASNLIYSVGIVKINGVSYTGVLSIDVDFGIQEMVERADGYTWPKGVVIGNRAPRIMVQLIDPTQSAGALTTTVSGKAIASDTCVYFQKRATGGRFVSAVTAEHIKLTIAAGFVFASAGGGDPRTVTLAIVPTKGVADSIQISTASAMS